MNRICFFKRLALMAVVLFFMSLCAWSSLHASNIDKPVVVQLFDETPICFNSQSYPGNVWQGDGIVRLGNGRVILKKIKFPTFNRNVTVRAKIKLTSNGDSWDKSGSCFVIPSSSAINMIEVAAGRAKYPTIDTTEVEHLQGIIPGDKYAPAVELMRFMTPFGVGHYSKMDSITAEKRKPVYIDEFAPCVEWEQDITDRYSLLNGEAYVGAFIDTWTKEGYKISVELSFRESYLKCDKLPKRKVLPLVNTVYYFGQGIPDMFARKTLNVPFTLPKGAQNVRISYIVTGHGGHEGGDEFVKRENVLSVDGGEVMRFTPWRNDCASFRRFNPSTGVWLIKRKASYISDEGKRAEKEIEEPVGSSDLSRSNWCPGSCVAPMTVYLNNVTAGNHTFSIAIPKAQSAVGEKLNHWLVSAYVVWEE